MFGAALQACFAEYSSQALIRKSAKGYELSSAFHYLSLQINVIVTILLLLYSD